MVRSRIKGLLDKADRMGWFIFGQSEYKKARASWVSSLELEPLNLNDETLRWSRAEWYQLFVIPISKEAEKRKPLKFLLLIFILTDTPRNSVLIETLHHLNLDLNQEEVIYLI